MTMAELGEVLDGKRTLPAKPVVLTFDDGYRDFYTDVFPLLKTYGTKATVYVIPGFLNGSNYLTDAQLQEIAGDNTIEIAAHTVHHVWLKNMPREKAQQEIVESKTALETAIHKPVVSFAYPYGAFDEQAISLVKQAGFSTAVSTIPGVTIDQADRFFIFRLRPGGRTGDGLVHFLDQVKVNPYK